MRKLGTVTLTGVNTQAVVERGRIELEKGRAMYALGLKFSFTLANAAVGAKTLSDAEKQTFLDGFRITLSYGKSGRRKPFNSIKLSRLQRISRETLRAEWEGYANTTTGLGTEIAGSGSQAMVFYAMIPTAGFRKDKGARRLFGVGRTQASTMQLEVRRDADGVPADVTISGNVTAELVPFEDSAPFDRWFYLPEWIEQDETGKVAYLPEGLPILVTERTAVHASSALTDFGLQIDNQLIHDKVSAAEALIEYQNQPTDEYNAEADTSNRETLLYVTTAGASFEDLPTGKVRFEQFKKDLGTTLLGALIQPIPTEDEVRDDIAEAASSKGRNKVIRGTSLAEIFGYQVPARLHPYVAFALLDTDDQEFQRYPGLISENGAPASVFLPASIVDTARALVSAHDARGEHLAAENVIRQVALAIPGAVQGARGFAQRGSVILDQVRGLITGQ